MKYSIVFFIIVCSLYSDEIQSVGFITALSGTGVFIRGRKDSSFTAQLLGELVYGDTVKTAEGSAVTVLLSDGTLKSASDGSVITVHSSADSTGAVPVQCPSASPIYEILSTIRTNSEQFVSKAAVQGEAPEDSFVLTMYAPGNTSIVTRSPKIVWNKCPEANWYSVVITRGREVVSSIATVDTLCEYIEQGDSLEQGSYRITIWALSNGDTLTMTERVMTILGDDELQELERSIAWIDSQRIDPFSCDLLRAIVYQSYGLRHKAIAVYQELIDMHPEYPALYRLLAYLYGELGISAVSKKYFDAYNTMIVK